MLRNLFEEPSYSTSTMLIKSNSVNKLTINKNIQYKNVVF